MPGVAGLASANLQVEWIDAARAYPNQHLSRARHRTVHGDKTKVAVVLFKQGSLHR